MVHMLTWRIFSKNTAKLTIALAGAAFVSVEASAQTIPGPADVNRIDTAPDLKLPETLPDIIEKPDIAVQQDAPAATKGVYVNLKKVKLGGVTAFSEAEIAKIYNKHIGKRIRMDVVWQIAAEITQEYRDNGYFLSRAYVPRQEIEKGIVRINVVEGYVGYVSIGKEYRKSYIVKQHIDAIKQQKPLSSAQLASDILRLNDLPGVDFSGTLKPLKKGKEGQIKLDVADKPEDARLSVNFNNHGSRFLGPYQASMTYQESFLPWQLTTISASASLPEDELGYVAAQHEIPITREIKIQASGSYVASEPGADLEQQNIKSSSADLALKIEYQPIRQRTENFKLSAEFAGKNTNGDVLDNNPLTRDRVRKLALQADYDFMDEFQSYNFLTATVNRGLDVLGASQAGELNLSRAQAEPDFLSLNLSYVRQQFLNEDFVAIGQLAAQLSNDPLYSAEEFGYGGMRFGRAYDPSEITGDSGFAASLELRYMSMKKRYETSITPYVFFDAGYVYNEDDGVGNDSAHSAGLGVSLAHDTGIGLDLALAAPLSKDIGTPIYGNGDNLRFLFQLSYSY